MFNSLISIYNINKKIFLYQDIFAKVSFLNSIRFESKNKSHFSEILSENFIVIYMNYLPHITSRLSVIFQDKTYSINKIIEYNQRNIQIFASNNDSI